MPGEPRLYGNRKNDLITKTWHKIFFGSVLETRENYGVSVLSKTGKVEQTLIINTLKKIGSKNTWEDFFRGVVIHVPLLYMCKI